MWHIASNARLLWVASIALASACDDAPAAPPLAAADVSFLLPLDAGPAATTRGAFGELLPRARYDRLEPISRTLEPDFTYARLRVVAVRLDPCFTEGTAPSACRSQVRLVLQPVSPVAASPSAPLGLTAEDAAIHAFYAVPEAELLALAEDLAALRIAASGPLELGVRGEPAAAIARVLEVIGAERLVRLTTMSVHPTGEAWIFAGVELPAETPILIPGVGEPEQHITVRKPHDELDATLLPDPTLEPAIAPYLAAARRADLTASDVTAAIDAFERLLDPNEHNPGTVDCASCHVATAALHFWRAAHPPETVPSAYAVTGNLRMFGYFGAMPSISPRIDAETALVLRAFAARGLSLLSMDVSKDAR